MAAFAAWALIRSGMTPETLALAASCLVVFMAAGVAAGADRRPDLVRVIALAWLGAAALSTAIALIQYLGQSAHLAPWVSAASACSTPTR